MLHHAGHRHSEQPVRLVVIKDVTPLAVQEQHDGLKDDRKNQSLSCGTASQWFDD